MCDKKEITFYKFYSGMRTFLSRLIDSPINADIPDFMKDNDLTRKKVINDLINKDVIERHERILDKTNSDKEKPTYTVKYKVKRKNFERKMHRLYSKYFESDKTVNESTDCASCDGQYTTVINQEPVKRNTHIYSPKGDDSLKKMKNKKNKKITLTESQLAYLEEFYGTRTNGDTINEDGEGVTATNTIGSIGNYTANGLVLKDSNGNPDPSYDRNSPKECKKVRKIMVTEEQLNNLIRKIGK